MRFTFASLALFAGAALAEQTVVESTLVTDYTCAPTVPNCPARSHHPAPATGTSPAGVAPTGTSPAGVKPTGVPPAPGKTGSVAPYPSTPAGVAPTGFPGPSGASGTAPSASAPTGKSPKPTGVPPKNAAGALEGSIGLAGAAAVAVLLA